jgi:hypothetical protein
MYPVELSFSPLLATIDEEGTGDRVLSVLRTRAAQSDRLLAQLVDVTEQLLAHPREDRLHDARNLEVNQITSASPAIALYVVGGAGSERNPRVRDFPLIKPADGRVKVSSSRAGFPDG